MRRFCELSFDIEHHSWLRSDVAVLDPSSHLTLLTTALGRVYDEVCLNGYTLLRNF